MFALQQASFRHNLFSILDNTRVFVLQFRAFGINVRLFVRVAQRFNNRHFSWQITALATLSRVSKILIDGDPCSIIENEIVKPGKGQAFNRVKIRNLKTGRVVDRTYKSGESLEAADVMETIMEFLYSDGEMWHFMEPTSFEQYAADQACVGDAKLWLKEQAVCTVTLWNGGPLMVEPPKFVEMAVVETDPGVRGDTASGGVKPATLESGAVVRVPLFVEQGEVIKVDTRSGEYVSRVK